MSNFEYTAEQQRVIDIRNSNVLVSAAAGSGKTAVLTRRILSLITDDNHIDVDRLLVLTFTQAAAAEMKERIGKAISDSLNENPGDENLWKQSALISGAHISTIHRFCLFVIKNNFADIELDPGFSVADEGETKLLLRDTVDAIFEKHFADGDKAFENLVECYSDSGDERALADCIISLHNYVMSATNPDKWMADAISLYEKSSVKDICESELYRSQLVFIDSFIDDLLRESKRLLGICNAPGGPSKGYGHIFEYLVSFFELFKSHTDYEGRYTALNAISIPRGKGTKTEGEDPDIREKIIEGNNKLKKKIDKLNALYELPPEIIESDSRFVAGSVKEIMVILREVMDAFEIAKREKNIIDFSDMEHLALRILSKKEVADQYREFFAGVMVDEYQDSNRVQEAIIKSICRDDNYFMVGDIKQSIYRFRQACPDLFREKYESFKDDGIDVRIDLNNNFRSRKEVLDFSNEIFGEIMHKENADIEYDDKAKLYHGENYFPPTGDDRNRPEVLLLENPDNLKPEGISSVKGAHAYEAIMVAERINRFIKEEHEVYDKEDKKMRPVTYRDIVILLRAMDSTYKEVLEEMGIPVHMDETTGYFKTSEVQTVLNYVSVIDNPRQDIPLYGSLISYFGGFSEENIAFIKGVSEADSLYDALRGFDRDDELGLKVKSFLQTINEFREMSAYLTVVDLLEKVVLDTGYINYITAFPQGDRRRANVLMLIERAKDFEKTSYHGLFHYIRYIGELKASEVDYGEAGTIDEHEDVVRIMTIHKSKGLEFPICFVCNCSKDYNMMDVSAPFVADMDYGLGLKYINPVTRQKRMTYQRTLIAEKIKYESISEEIRVLYVALTRAMEKIIVTGQVKNVDEYVSFLPKDGEITPYMACTTDGMLAHVCMGLSSAGTLDKYLVKVPVSEVVGNKIGGDMQRAVLQKNLEELRNVDENNHEALRERLTYNYPYEKLKGLYIKTSVSDIKKNAHKDEEDNPYIKFENKENAKEEPLPTFARGSAEAVGASGAERGSAYHRVMELLPYALITDDCDKKCVLENAFTERPLSDRITKEQLSYVKMGDIVDFLNSPIGIRMKKAFEKGLLYREKSFFLGISADRVKPEFPHDETMLIQGIIDACFEEDGQMILLDYKTDKVRDGEELVKLYKTQLDYYAEAIERIMHKPVKEKIIYSFALKSQIILL